jgi:hypothetical protein
MVCLLDGRLPERFSDTAKTEYALVNRAQSSAAIGGYNRTVPAAMLARDIHESGEIKVGIAGAMTSEQIMILMRKFAVRLDLLKSLGEFYKKIIFYIYMQMWMLQFC